MKRSNSILNIFTVIFASIGGCAAVLSGSWRRRSAGDMDNAKIVIDPLLNKMYLPLQEASLENGMEKLMKIFIRE